MLCSILVGESSLENGSEPTSIYHFRGLVLDLIANFEDVFFLLFDHILVVLYYIIIYI